ncbi:MAG: protein translocase subunit SecDF, partial [Alistipes sp.]|nr:protein translocase subunit SecDF [Alistipes sp.]
MQSKGIIKWLAALLALACVFQLSFTFVTRKVESDAAKQENPQAYLDEKWDDVVYNLGFVKYTYEDCKNRELNLGLDLKGGMNVMLEIKAEDVIRANADSKGVVRTDAELNARMEKALYEASKVESASAAVDAFIAASNEEDLKKIFNASDVAVLATDLKTLIDGSVGAAFNVLQNRIDLLGVTQPNIQLVTGTNRISVELPGVKEPERVGKLLASTANLEFWEVYSQEDISEVTSVLYSEELNEAVRDYLLLNGVAEEEVEAKLPRNLISISYEFTAPDGQSYTDMTRAPMVGAAQKENLSTLNEYFRLPSVKALFPSDVELAWSNKSVNNSAKGAFALYALRGLNGVAAPVLDGTGITNSRAQGGQNGGFEVSMTMNSETAIKWADITERNTNKQIAIVLDGYVYSAPVSHGRIDGGSSSITGNFDVQEAEDLASVLNSGKAPAP